MCMFVTYFMGILDIRTGEVEYCNAGHNPPFILRANGTLEKVDELHGMPLGVMEDAVYKESQKQINPGQIILIGTDGIKESVNANGEMFGNKRLLNVIRDYADKSAREILDKAFESLNNFRHPLEADDDETLVVIKVL